ncbi:hypothetical protein CO151_04530 [bacterium CG_4_9_14_3_um_filter_65_15]|nr:MAG: hypothetical protein CO151_04530 [bacterium CG_4_9_14_3_um_filter_65_15]
MNDQDGRRSRGRSLLVFWGKVSVSALLIWFVLSRQSLTGIKAAMTHPRWEMLLAAFAVYGVSALAGSLQWAWILRAGGIPVSRSRILRVYFIGLFFNNFLPANIGGDAWKIVDLGGQEGRRLGVFCATLLDRLIGLGALALLAVLVLAAASGWGIPLPQVALVMVPVLLLLAVILMVLLSRRLGAWGVALLERLHLGTLAAPLQRVTGELALYRPRVRWLQLVFLFSVGVQFLRMATHILVALGLGSALTSQQAVQLLVLVPVLAVSLTLPVTINGIGLRESISANLLTWTGLAGPEVVALEVAAYLVQVLFSLSGGVMLLVRRR